jgi:hypothetical protein
MKEGLKNIYWMIEANLTQIIFAIIIITMLSLLMVVAVATTKEQERWDEFAYANNCKVIRITRPTTSIGTGIGTNGQVGVVTVTSARTVTYLCDDGIEYQRNGNPRDYTK